MAGGLAFAPQLAGDSNPPPTPTAERKLATGLPASPAFAHGVIMALGSTHYAEGQSNDDAEGARADGLKAQTAQAMRIVLIVL